MTNRFERSNTKSNGKESTPNYEISRVRSLSAMTKSHSHEKEIIINLDEPDLPRITLLKIDNSFQDKMVQGSLILFRTTNQLITKRLHATFCQLLRLSCTPDENKNKQLEFSSEFVATCNKLTRFNVHTFANQII